MTQLQSSVMGEGMGQVELPAAIDAAELQWTMTSGEHVLCYHRPGEGRPVLLLHSINAAPSAYEVSPFFDAMTLQRPLYAPDLPGFGRSDRRDRVYSPAFFADAIIDMLRAIDAGPVDVVALSTTAEFAARAAGKAPELFSSLTLISPTGFTRRRDSPSTVGPKVHRVLTLPFLGAGLFRALRTRPSVRHFLNMGFTGSVPESMVDYACRTSAQPGASHAPFYFLSMQLFDADAVGNLYLPLELPVLVLFDQDPNISFDFLPDVLESRSNWQAVRIPETLGLPHFEKPAQTYEAIESFWARL
jgi:pimeloyl-ACP methyl ester carboxylesterase